MLTTKVFFLPDTGLLRLSTVLRFVEVSPADWWAGVKTGIYPRPVKVPKGKTRWRAEDIREFILRHVPNSN